MLEEFAENGMANIEIESSDRSTAKTAMSNLAVEPSSEETHELGDRLSQAIAGGFMRRELSDAQLETIAFRNVARVIRIIGFEN
jgi:hypothetical protein